MCNFPLLNTQMMGSIGGTTTYEGARNPQSSAFFISQNPIFTISTAGGCCRFVDFAKWLISRNKAHLRANKASLSYEVVETISHPFRGDSPLSLTKHTENQPMKTTQKSTALNRTAEQSHGYSVILTYKNGSEFECAEGVTLARAVQIKNDVKRAAEAQEFAFADVVNIAIIPSLTAAEKAQGGEDE